MTALKLTRVGDSVGVVLPQELLSRLGLKQGDTVYAVETEDGVRLSTSEPEFAAQLEVARKLMRERRAVLRELAK